MKRAIALLLTCGTLTGCDSFFVRTVDLLPDRQVNGTYVPADTARVKAAVRAFARELDLDCADGQGNIIIECRRQPISVWAVHQKNSVAVCFGAIGVPFETRKYRERMDQMQSILTQEFGKDVVRVLEGPCPRAEGA